MTYNIQPEDGDEKAAFEAIKRLRNYSGQEYKGKELGRQLDIRWL